MTLVDSPRRLESGNFRVPVTTGCSIAVTVRKAESPPVLAIHGISSNSRLWIWLLQVAPKLSLIMPDLRGRGESFHGQGELQMNGQSNGNTPFKIGSSVQQHSDDMTAVLNYFCLGAVDVLGMSMGGFVAVNLAATYPDRVRSLTLIDGGPPMRPPDGLTVNTEAKDVAKTALNDRTRRLNRTWSLKEYRDFFTSATAPLIDPEDPLLEEYLRYDLGLDHHLVKGCGRVRLDGASLTADAADIFSPASLARWLDPHVKPIPTRMSRAEWSVGKYSQPAYGPKERKAIAGRLLREEIVSGQDHAGTIMTLRGARIARDLLSDVLQMDLACEQEK